jgi:hypothetical protein
MRFFRTSYLSKICLKELVQLQTAGAATDEDNLGVASKPGESKKKKRSDSEEGNGVVEAQERLAK